MTTSIKNLKNEVDSRLAAGGLDALACCQLQNAQIILNNSVVTTVPNLASLPSAALNEGRLVYVDDINEYRIADDIGWVDDVSSVLRSYKFNIFSWGYNNQGQIGDGTGPARTSPVREISSANDWCHLSAGAQRTGAIKTSGQLWLWGCSSSAQLGDGTGTNKCSPVREFCSATDWCQVSMSGFLNNAAVKTSGQIWVWGANTCGALGDGTTTNRCSPVREFCSATDWCRVSTGGNNTAAVKTSGQIWAWGASAQGQVGDGSQTNRCSPVREFCSATDWCGVSVGNLHVAAIKTTGQIWSWGYGSFGNGFLGDGTTTQRCSPVREISSSTDWCQVNAGYSHTSALKTTGQLWSWGNNACGALGDGTAASKCSPVREICSATDWCQVSSGCLHSLAVKTSGQIWAWGNNVSGQLGDGFVTSRCSPVRERCSATSWCQVSAGCRHSAAINALCKGFLEI